MMAEHDAMKALMGARQPFGLFADWVEEARAAGEPLPEAMGLATNDARGFPNLRMVLLKQAGREGFVFYTDMESVKAREMEKNPSAALCLYWKSLRRQIRARGFVKKVERAEADAYFGTRPRLSQLSAWASRQSRSLGSRAELEARVQSYEKKFSSQDVPRPEKWAGFRLMPVEIEFWIDRPSRLHDRVLFSRSSRRGIPHGAWRKKLLQP